MFRRGLVSVGANAGRASGGVRLLRKCACADNGTSCARCSSERQPLKGAATALDWVPPIVNEVLASPGQPLDRLTRKAMQARFDQDFSHVRVHSDARAGDSAKAVSAKAYTVGPNIVFGRDRYSPDTSEGKRLLAHELAHVVQQGRGGAAPVKRRDGPLEADADRAATTVAQSESIVKVASSSGVGLAMEEDFYKERTAQTGLIDDRSLADWIPTRSTSH